MKTKMEEIRSQNSLGKVNLWHGGDITRIYLNLSNSIHKNSRKYPGVMYFFENSTGVWDWENQSVINDELLVSQDFFDKEVEKILEILNEVGL